MSVSEELGISRQIKLSAGPVTFRERGTGPVIVFVHPMVVNGDLWRKVVPLLADRHRCITPDWPLGGHAAPMDPDADLSPPGIAGLVAEFLAALDLEDVTLVGNDTGGAIAQIVATRNPERLARLVIITSDAFDNFPPRLAKPLQWLSWMPGAMPILVRVAGFPLLRRLPVTFGWLTKRPIDPHIIRAYLEPSRRSRAVRRDGVKALRQLAPQHTREAALGLASFNKPALVIWNREDHFFPFDHARQLTALIPNARLVEIDDSYTFIPEDQPERLAAAIAAFLDETADN